MVQRREVQRLPTVDLDFAADDPGPTLGNKPNGERI